MSEQLGLALGVAGQKKVLDKEVAAWKELAIDRIRKLCASGMEFTIEGVYRVAGKPPRHYNSAGGIIPAAKRAGVPIVWTGRMVKSPRPSRHTSLVRVWQGRRPTDTE